MTWTRIFRNVAQSSLMGVALVLAGSASSSSEPVSEFYRGRTLSLVVGYSAGGGYDLYARALSRHIGRHIPGNPNVVVQNMPGAGSRKATQFMFQAAPRDGTYIATVGRNEPVAPLIEKDANFDARKLVWLGSIASDNSVCIASSKAPVKSAEDMFKIEMTLGALSAGDNTVNVPAMLSNLLGAKLKIVTGYPGTPELLIALERNEIDGICGISWRAFAAQRLDWITEGKVRILLEVAFETDPDMPRTPSVLSFLNHDQKAIFAMMIATQAMARPFFASAGIPEDRANTLRAAFAATMADQAFVNDLGNMGLFFKPLGGKEIESLIHSLYASPADVIEQSARAIRYK